eukprot:COSAG02_NODE_5566_length_4225_cov_6.497576_3_plen_153_part_00
MTVEVTVEMAVKTTCGKRRKTTKQTKARLSHQVDDTLVRRHHRHLQGSVLIIAGARSAHHGHGHPFLAQGDLLLPRPGLHRIGGKAAPWVRSATATTEKRANGPYREYRHCTGFFSLHTGRRSRAEVGIADKRRPKKSPHSRIDSSFVIDWE